VVTGKIPSGLHAFESADMKPLPLPSLNEFKDWLLMSNPDILAKAAAWDSARQEINKSLADHSPTVDLVISKSQSNNGSDVAVGRVINTTSLGVQLNIPLFSGGATQSVVRQARANALKAEEDLKSIRRKLEVDLERYYFATLTAAEKLESSRLAISAAELSVRQVVDGLAAGIKTRADQIESEAKLLRAKQEMVKVISDYILGYIQLWGATGRLDLDLIAKLEAGIQANGL
jgi:outer membrane protein TolC